MTRVSSSISVATARAAGDGVASDRGATIAASIGAAPMGAADTDAPEDPSSSPAATTRAKGERAAKRDGMDARLIGAG